MIKIAFALAAAGAVFMTSPLLVGTAPAKAWPKASTFRLGGIATTGTVGGTTQTLRSASARVASPSAHDDAAAR